MKVYSLEETLTLIDYYSDCNWLYRLNVLLNTQIENKEYDNDIVNKFFIAVVKCINDCFQHYNRGSNSILKVFFTSEIVLVLNKIKEKVKPIFVIDVIPEMYGGDIIYIKVNINNINRYYEYVSNSGFKSIKEGAYLELLKYAAINNTDRLNYIPLKEMEF